MRVWSQGNFNGSGLALGSIMSAIGIAESSGRSNALNNRPGREYSVGLWQINLLAHPQYSRPQMEDPLQNARAALAIYRSQGLRA